MLVSKWVRGSLHFLADGVDTLLNRDAGVKTIHVLGMINRFINWLGVATEVLDDGS